MNDASAKPRVILVDDHPLIRSSLAGHIRTSGVAEVVAEAADTKDIVALVGKMQPDLVIMDISMPGCNGIDATRRITSAFPGVKVLILSMHEEKFHARESLQAGASGYVMKEEATEKLLLAIRKVLDGGVYVSDATAQTFAGFLVHSGKWQAPGSIESLSKRQLEVFRYIGEGLQTRAIAEKMGLNIKTIETFRVQIKRKLGVANATALTRHAVEWVTNNPVDSTPNAATD